VTGIDGERFLNVQQLGEKDNRDWLFVRYRIDGNRLVLRVVEDTLFGTSPFASSEALRSFVGRNLTDPRLYSTDDSDNSEMTWQRADA